MDSLPVNIWKLLILFALLLVILDVILVRWIKLGKKGWKKTEYIWLGLIALSLISTSAEVRNWLSEQQAQSKKVMAEAQFSLLRNYIGETEPPIYICRKFTRTEYSPDNFDEIQVQHDAVCEWNKILLKELPNRIGDDLPELKYSKFQLNKRLENDTLNSYLSAIEMYISNYEKLRAEYMVLRKASTRTEIELVLFFISPILLCFALALRITKVTGEIKLET